MEEDEDLHICLVCHRTIAGLLNYVNHKKNECTGRKEAKEIQETEISTVNSVTGIRNQGYGLGTSTTYINQPVFTSGDNYQNQDAVNLLNSQTNITSSLDVFDTPQFQTNTTDTNLQDICLKTYSPPTTQNTSSSHSLYDSQASITNQHTSCDLAGFALSPSIFTHGNSNKTRDSTANNENHGLLTACISNGVEVDFGNAVNIHIPNTFPILSSEKSPNPNSGAININEIISDSHGKSQSSNKNATEKVDDFFQSLELMSKTNPKTEKGANFNQPLLPISNIFNNLTFSSDEEDLEFNFADDVSLDSMTENSDDDRAPPSNYTGAKWKPGEKPGTTRIASNRPVFRGKWPPGQVPEQTSAKYYGGRPKGGKNISSLLSSKTKKAKSSKQTKSLSSKTFHCNFCDVTFQCRFKYSNHCGSASHKERVFGKREEFQVSFGAGKGKTASVRVKTDSERDHEAPEAGDEEHTEMDRDSAEVMDEQLSEKDTEEVELENATKDKEDNVNLTSQDDEANESTNNGNIYSAVPLQIHVCTVCDKKFPNKYFMSNHMLTKYHRNRTMANKETAFALLQRYNKYIVRLSPYQCAICRYYFNKFNYFESHLESEEHLQNCEDLIGEMTCSLCKFKTHSHDELLEHISCAEHKGNMKCNRLFIIKESHVECRCKYCGLVMRSFSKLKYHVQHKHGDKQVITGVTKRKVGVINRPSCPECNQQFQSNSGLKLHITRKHTGEKPHKCEVCDVSFADKHALRHHKKTAKHMQNLCAEEMVTNKQASENDDTNKSKDKNSTKLNDITMATAESNIVNIEMVFEDKLENKPGVYEKDCDKGINVNQEYTLKIIDDFSEEKNVVLELDDPMEDESDTGENFDAIDLEDEWTPSKKAVRKSRTPKKPREQKVIKEKVVKRRKKRKEQSIKIFKCDHCSFTANSYGDLRPHYLQEHSTQIKICELCDQLFLSEKAYKVHEHSREHQQNINRTGDSVSEKYYTCHVCKKKFTDEKYCKFHTAYHHFHPTTEDAVLLENDGKDVTRMKYETVLSEIKDLDPKDPVQCPECKNTLKKINFLEHLRTHTGDKPFKCKMCPKACISSITLRRHLLGHFGCQDCTCEVCGKQFKKISTFEEHMKMHVAQSGDAGKVHTCEKCGQAFYFERQLQVHMRRHGKREFACTYEGCHWKFLVPSELNKHLQSHTDHKPFLCDICGYASRSKSRLQRHHRTHTGERNYQCEYCTYKAGNSTHLHRHMRIHIGSKPFKCPYCQYACNTHENIRKHIVNTKKHEGLSIYPCKLCKYGTNSCKEFRNHLHEMHTAEIGPNFQMAALSTFTGLFDKSLDPKKPEEGNKIFQVRERVKRDSKPKKSKNPKPLTPEEQEDKSTIQKSEKVLDGKNSIERKNNSITGIVNKRRKMTKIGNETGNINQINVSRKVLNSDVKHMHSETSDTDNMLIRTQAPEVTGIFYSPSISQMRLQNDAAGHMQSSMDVPHYTIVPDSHFKPSTGAHNIKSELQFSLSAGTGRSLSIEHYNQTGSFSNKHSTSSVQTPAELEVVEAKPTILMYHDYCTKYGQGRETDETGNLIIDVNFSAGQ